MTTVAYRKKTAHSGYSIIEIALALLVTAVGVTAVFALLPKGLEMGRKAVDATEISAFADFVFASLENDAAVTNEAAVVGSFEANISHALDSEGGPYPGSQPIVMETGAAGPPRVFYWRPGYYGEGLAVYVDRYEVATFTYTLDVRTDVGFMIYARLEVWPGDRTVGWSSSMPGSTVYYRNYRTTD